MVQDSFKPDKDQTNKYIPKKSRKKFQKPRPPTTDIQKKYMKTNYKNQADTLV